jgi:hypothetical protein
MLPTAYEVPVAVALVLGGALACFAGYRLFRVVLGVYGFLLGAMIASSIAGTANTAGMVGAALAGGLAGAVILVLAWFVGVALVGAGLGALLAHLVWSQLYAGDPPAVAVILVSVAGALTAMVLQRYVIIVGTAFGGGWTVVVGAVALMASQAVEAAAAEGAAWVLYPLSPAPGQRWVPVAWVAVGILGTAVQMRVTGKKRW